MDKTIKGKLVSEELRKKIKEEVDFIKESNKEDITLAIIQVGDDQASSTYVRNKTKACNEVGIKYCDYKMDKYIDSSDIINLIKQLNASEDITGILVQLPLPRHIDEAKVLQSIDPLKDVDCFNYSNIGRLYTGNPRFLPCTPAGIIELCKYYNIELAGKECVIIGRSNIVGKPLAAMMTAQNATVTLAHSKTENLEEVCKRADIIVSAIGCAKFINKDYIKPGAVIIDVGINRDHNNKLCGDVDFDDVYDICDCITPVPGGVGPMTITMLLRNCIKAYNYQISIED